MCRVCSCPRAAVPAHQKVQPAPAKVPAMPVALPSCLEVASPSEKDSPMVDVAGAAAQQVVAPDKAKLAPGWQWQQEGPRQPPHGPT